jgi:hypothetical protein|tara:strand:+ start:66 stop:902 length:837 start_codon:yes stop_codon:yes gene_type:complete
MNIWETHDMSNMRKVSLPKGDFYYVMDEFYKYPDLVVKEIKKLTPASFKIRQIEADESSYNDKFFKDHRNEAMYRGLYRLNWDLGKLVKQEPIHSDQMEEYKMGIMYTNHATIYKHSFNDLHNSYWYPHIDTGWNGIVYLNKNDSGKNGTNIYSIKRNKRRILDKIMNSHEHHYPWISKSQIDRISYIPSKYNSFAFYNGVKYFHGMNIGDDQYVCDMGGELEEERINQVFFFHDDGAVRRNRIAYWFIDRHSGPVNKVVQFIKKLLKKYFFYVHTGV